MARYFLADQGKKVNCPYCKQDFVITEACLYQPSYEVQVSCANCDVGIHELSVWSTYDKDGKRLFDKSTEEIIQEAIDTLGFLPRYDRDRWPITFTSSAHKDKTISNGYDLVADIY